MFRSWTPLVPLALMLVGMVACSKTDPGSGNQNIYIGTNTFGLQVDGVTQVAGRQDFSPISGVKVDAKLDGSVVKTVLSGTDGSFTIGLPFLTSERSYSLEASHSEYLTCIYNEVQSIGNVFQTSPLMMIPLAESTGNGTIGGMISDAFDGKGVADMALVLRSGFNTTQGSPITGSWTTDATGKYLINDLPAGYYTVEGTKTGYMNTYFDVVSLGGKTLDQQNAAAAPAIAAGQYRIVVTWGATPMDLDSHMTGPKTGGTRFHVYWVDKRYPDNSNDPDCALDHDDTTSYGPETITIYKPQSGTYKYYIHDFSNAGASASHPSNALARSGAVVKIYDATSSRPVAVFSVPGNKSGNLWKVFELDYTSESVQIRIINQMTYTSDYDVLPVRGEPGDESSIGSRPSKR